MQRENTSSIATQSRGYKHTCLRCTLFLLLAVGAVVTWHVCGEDPVDTG